MIRSLRLRFFLITWPLVVAAVGFVALTFGRWTRVELQVLETVVATGEPRVATALAARLSRLWTGPGGLRAVREALPDLAASHELPTDLIVLDPGGEVLATTDPAVRPLPHAGGVDGSIRFVRGHGSGPRREEVEIDLPGVPIRGENGAPLGTLFVVPAPTRPRPASADALRADARRTLWTAFAVASAAAALAALLLADAAAAVREGALESRVPEGGQDELGRLERSFNAMADALERAEAQQRNLVSDVAHELRTPLTNIAGMLEAVEDGLAVPDDATLASLGEEVTLLTRLVEDLQELSLAESGQLPYDLQPLDVVEEAGAALASVSATGPGVSLVGPSASIPVFATGDRGRLGQVLRNLLRNALTHTPPGGTVSIEVEPRGEAVAILVRDTGTGIPEEHLDRVWERFHRVDPSRGRDSGGMGLGLALVRQLVVGMGGRVGVSSRVGEGTTFEVVLRAAREPEQRVPEARINDAGGTP